jgi:hypothetical protein
MREVVVALPSPVPPLRAVRTTLLLSSQDALRWAGLYDAYLTKADAHRDALVSMVAGAWVSVDVAMAHYRAAERLGLAPAQVTELGQQFSTATHNVFSAALLRASRELGATPWTLFARAERAWGHSFDGSAVGIERVGPKEAHITIAGTPLAAVTYFRSALAGFAVALTESAASKAYVKQIPAECRDTTIGYRLSWA